MDCSRQQIEEKRKLALQKLADRKKQQQQQSPQTPQPPNRTLSVAYQRPAINEQLFNRINQGSINQVKAQEQNSPVKQQTENFSPIKQQTFYSNNERPLFKAQPFSNGQNNFSSYGKQQQQATLSFGNTKNVVTVKASLASKQRFVVDLSCYSPPVIEAIKAVPSRFYEPKSKQWSLSVAHHDMLQSKLLQMKPDVAFEPLPKYAQKICQLTPDYSTFDLRSIDEKLLTALMPFQEEGVCFGVDKNGRCLIADDMGLGKTFQALAIADYYKSDWPLLIVTTASMRRTWEETIYNYLPSVPIMKVMYMTSAKDFIDASDVLIVSHDLMSRAEDRLHDRGFGVIIIDESHVLKNFKAKCTKAAAVLTKRAKRVVLLSGTPALSRPAELYSQLALLDERFFGSFREYSRRYCNGQMNTFGWDASGQSNLQELEVVLAAKFMIRRTKNDVLKSLPNKKQEVIKLDVNLNLFSEDDRQCLIALAAKYNTVKKDKHAALLPFFAETAKIKIPSVCSYILQTLEVGGKFLVFAHHQIMLNAVEQVLLKKKKKYIRIDGNTTCDQRKYFVDKFQLDDSYVCAVLSITAANAGITLTAAHLVLFAELHWNPSILSQAEARAHRIGQEHQVVIQYLIAPGTADDHIWPLLESKQKTLREIGLMGDTFDDVSVRSQSNAIEGMAKECLNSSVTIANTLDITSYFTKSPSKKNETDFDLSPSKIDQSGKGSSRKRMICNPIDSYFNVTPPEKIAKSNPIDSYFSVSPNKNDQNDRKRKLSGFNDMLNDDCDDIFSDGNLQNLLEDDCDDVFQYVNF